MTPPKRRPATPASQGPTRTAPDVPIVAPDAPVPAKVAAVPLPPVKTADSTKDAPTETGQADADDRATTPQSPRRPLSLYPLPVWPD
jgi:hypothetical protein